MRVLHITTSGSNAGGVTQYIRRLSYGLIDRGCSVCIAGSVPSEAADRGPFEWIDANTDGGLVSLWKTAKILQELGPFDIVHTHYRKASMVGRRVATHHRAPMVFTLHMPNIPMDPIRRILSDFGDITHAPSAQAARWLTEIARVPKNKINVIPHGIDTAAFPRATKQQQVAARRALGLPVDKVIAAFVGRFEHPKNEFWIADLARAAPQVSVVMMGGGSGEGKLKGQPITLLPYGDPLVVYQATDILLSPSAIEGFSLVAAEAMSVGRPVLRTRTGGVDEMIMEGVTGFSCPINRDDFVALGISVLKDRDRLLKMGEAAAAHVRRHLHQDMQIDSTIALYRSLVSSFGNSRR